MTDRSAASIRVVEFPGGGIATAYAGWLLARLGADVHAVVPSAKEGAEALALQSLAEGKVAIPMPAAWDELLANAEVFNELCQRNGLPTLNFLGQIKAPTRPISAHKIYATGFLPKHTDPDHPLR